MNTKEFNKEVAKMCLKHNITKGASHYDYELKTVLGTWAFSCEYVPRIKLANIHSRFLDGVNLDRFKEIISDVNTPSKYSNKWNHYSEDPIYILDLLDETISNFNYLKSES
jgi:hypothetical protein